MWGNAMSDFDNNPITFNTQEEFERAVMKVLIHNLKVDVIVKPEAGLQKCVEVLLLDDGADLEPDIICSGWDAG